MSKHTPGEWIAVGTWVEHPDHDRPDICVCDPKAFGQGERSYEEAHANALLIAAATDLYAVLKEIVEFWDSIVPTDCVNGMHIKARTAIAKATGETK